MTSHCLRTIPRLPLLPLGVVWVTKSPSYTRPSHSSPVSWYLIQSSMLAIVASVKLWQLFDTFLLPMCRYISINSKYTTLCHINPIATLTTSRNSCLQQVWITMVSLFPFLICWSPAGWTNCAISPKQLSSPVLSLYIGTFKSTFASNPPESWHNHWIGLDITDMNFKWCCWCFRNPVNSPVEVGSLIPSFTGFVNS